MNLRDKRERIYKDCYMNSPEPTKEECMEKKECVHGTSCSKTTNCCLFCPMLIDCFGRTYCEKVKALNKLEAFELLGIIRRNR